MKLKYSIGGIGGIFLSVNTILYSVLRTFNYYQDNFGFIDFNLDQFFRFFYILIGISIILIGIGLFEFYRDSQKKILLLNFILSILTGCFFLLHYPEFFLYKFNQNLTISPSYLISKLFYLSFLLLIGLNFILYNKFFLRKFSSILIGLMTISISVIFLFGVINNYNIILTNNSMKFFSIEFFVLSLIPTFMGHEYYYIIFLRYLQIYQYFVLNFCVYWLYYLLPTSINGFLIGIKFYEIKADDFEFIINRDKREKEEKLEKKRRKELERKRKLEEKRRRLEIEREQRFLENKRRAEERRRKLEEKRLRLEEERKRLEQIKREIKDLISKLSLEYNGVTFTSLSKKLNYGIRIIKKLIKEMILSGEIQGKIRGNTLLFKEKKIAISQVKRIIKHKDGKKVTEWRCEMCSAPLGKAEVAKLLKNELIECPYCGSALTKS